MQDFIPKSFKERYSSLVDDPEQLFSCLLTYKPKAFRVNTIKANAKEVEGRIAEYGIALKQAAFYKDAFTTDSLELGQSIEHFIGHIYFQDLASMLPPLVIRDELEKAALVLDACAAPGSKTTLAAAVMGNKETIIANDRDYSRIRALKFNLEKMGVLNTVTTNCDFLRFSNKSFFDVILLDVPCSAEGTIRKNPEVFRSWNERDIRDKAGLQKGMITRAFDMLNPEGVMVYSTCTFAPEENEEVLEHLLEKKPGARIDKVGINGMKTVHGIEEWGKKKYREEVKNAVRIWPHFNDTDGFFLAVIRK